MKKRSFGARLCLALCATLAVQTARSDTMVLCMGDSITKGYGVNIPYPTRLTSNTGYSTVNAGVGGMRCSYGLSVVDSLLAQYNPLNVLIMYGTNDANDPNANMSNAADVIIQIAQRVRAYGAYPVIGTIPPQIGPRAYNMSRVRQFNGYLRTRAAANGFALADIEAAFGSGSGLFNSDGFHPNDSGAELIAQTFAPKVQVLSLSPTSTQVADVGAIGRAFSVVTPLSWTATANQPWISIISGATGTGNGTVMFNVAGQVGPARSGTIRVTSGSFSRTFTVNQSASPSLTVASRYGTPLPGAGTYWLESGTPISASIADSPVLIGVSTQYVCTGWTGTGSAPASGTNLETGTFTVMNASSVTWLWKTNYWLELTPTEGGTITVPSGWYPRGSNVVVRAVPDAGYKFVRWTGPYNTTAETFYATMTASKSFLATFALATNSLTVSSRYGMPEPAGTNWMRKDTTTNAGVAGSPIALGVSTQLACVGWTATGSAPKTGTGTNTGPFVLTNNTAIVWQWRTNFWLATAVEGDGTVSVASGWFGRGSNVALRATPAAGSRFFRWTGAAAGTSSNATVSMASAKAATAWFGVEVTVQARGLDGSAKSVAVRATPADVFQVSAGTTPRKFGYTNGTVVGLSAPEALAGGWKLVGWTGVDSWNGTNATWTANASNLVTALYDPPPAVAITNPTTLAAWSTTNWTLNLKGRASAFGGLVRIEASNARAERNRICTGTTNWSCEGLTLYPGANPITVTAYDAYTNATTGTLVVTCSSMGAAQMELAWLAGNVVRDVQMPDNLVPGSVCAVRWQVEAYEPVVSGLKIRLPEGSGVAQVTLNGRLAGTAPGSWTLGEWKSKIYSFEADWTVPQYPGTCRIRFLAARQDGYAYLNANVPAGVDAAPYGLDGKEIARTIAAGGTAPALQNEPLFKEAKPFDTMRYAHRRAGVVVRNLAVPDNLAPGSVVTCRWTLLSYPAALARLRFDLPTEADAFGTGTVARTTNGAWQLPVDVAIVEFDGTATNDALVKPTTTYKIAQRDLQYVWTVPNDPGTCRIAIETAMAAGSNWVGCVLREGVDGRLEADPARILRDVEETGAAPTVLELGTTNLAGNVRYAGDANWFEFTVPTAGTYRIQTAPGTLADTILKLYGPGNRNELVGQNDNAVGLASRLILPLEPGTYFVKITAPPPLKGTYKLVAAPAP